METELSEVSVICWQMESTVSERFRSVMEFASEQDAQTTQVNDGFLRGSFQMQPAVTSLDRDETSGTGSKYVAPVSFL
jgi:hypothetical protein